MSTLNDVMAQLGYPETQVVVGGTTVVSTRVEAIITRLTAVDQALDEAAIDAMATKVGDLEVDYVRGSWMLKLEGSRQLGLLSSTTGIPVYYDRFKGRLTSSPSISPLAVKASGTTTDTTTTYPITTFWRC